jgi:hypothetical protein
VVGGYEITCGCENLLCVNTQTMLYSRSLCNYPASLPPHSILQLPTPVSISLKSSLVARSTPHIPHMALHLKTCWIGGMEERAVEVVREGGGDGREARGIGV